jgi:hypothetical protein
LLAHFIGQLQNPANQAIAGADHAVIHTRSGRGRFLDFPSDDFVIKAPRRQWVLGHQFIPDGGAVQVSHE